MPKVTIIVPVHNPGKYLIPLLNSLINQTFQDIEIFLIDDGSTDGSRDILNNYALKDNRCKIFFRRKSQEERFGEKYSVDLGRTLANGEYIIIVDHDDELMLDTIEKLYNATENGTIDVVQGRNISINEENEIVYRTPDLWPNKTIIKDINNLTFKEILDHLVNAPVALWTCLIRKEFQKDLELTDCVFNDTDFIWKLKLTAQSFCYIPDYIYIQHEHKDSVSGQQRNNQTAFDIFISFNSLEKFIKQNFISYKLWELFAMYKFRMEYGHSGGDFSLNNYTKYYEKLKSEIKCELDVTDLIEIAFEPKILLAYQELMS